MTLRKLLVVASIIAVTAQLATAQNRIGSWADHFSYNNCTAVSGNANWTYGLTPSGIVKVNNSTFEVSRYTRVNLLSDVEPTAFLPLGNGEDFIVGYANGNIDIFSNNKLSNLPDILEKTISGSKEIMRFKQIGDNVMAMTGFGVVVLDIAKKEIADTWYLGKDNSSVVCYDILLKDGYYYVANANGLFKADSSNQFLSYYSTWENLSSTILPYYAVQEFNNQIVTVKKNGDGYTATSYNGAVPNDFASFGNYKNLYCTSNNLYITTSGSIDTYSQNLVLVNQKTSYKINESQTLTGSFAGLTISPSDNRFWYADNALGILRNNESGLDETYTPNGPSTNQVQDIVHNGTFLMAVPGRQTVGYNNGWLEAQINFYDGTWTNLAGSTNSLIKGQVDLFNITLDPKNPQKAYIASWANGVFEIEGKEIKAFYNSSNTPLKTIIANNPYYIRVGAAVADANGNIFISNSYVQAGLVVLNGEKQYVYSYPPIKTGWIGDMLIDQSGNFWTYNNVSENAKSNGLFVFDTNNTIDNEWDDRYRSAMKDNEDLDSRNTGQMQIVDQDGNIVTSIVYSLAIDKNGYLWVGTNKGPVVNYRPWAVFDEEVPIFNRIKIPRKDDENLADYLLDSEIITCITVDGANRKWLGTRSSGAYLVSEDGTETIHSFNTDNSPIGSNNIFSIAVDPNTGVVYFGTEKGIVSYKGAATEGTAVYSNVYAYPNPVPPGYSGDIAIKGMVANSNVKITSVTGTLVYETTSLGGQVVWNGRNMWGQAVQSGVYIVFMVDELGQEKAVTKILVVR
jgi:hypothetical protein